MEHDMPILVFNYRKEGNIERAVRGDKVGTLICSQSPVAAGKDAPGRQA
jgi:uridylate kinase